MNVNPRIQGRVTMLAEGIVGSPRVSGNGRVVVWDEFVDSNMEIMRYENGRVERLTRDPRPDMLPDLSADGRVVAWTRFSAADTHDPNGTWDVYQWRDGVESPVATGDGQNEPGH